MFQEGRVVMVGNMLSADMARVNTRKKGRLRRNGNFFGVRRQTKKTAMDGFHSGFSVRLKQLGDR